MKQDDVVGFITLPNREEKISVKNSKELSIRGLMLSSPYLQYRNESQKKFVEKIHKNEMIFCCGPAGTGKSMLKIYKALMLIYDNNSPYEKLIIIKPAVEAEEKLGFLPGDEKDKISVYVKSSLDLIDKMIGKKVREDLVEFGFIEVRSLAYMRGDNIDKSILIVEEAQNITKGQMKLLLTRIGENSKFIISGDLEQSDRFSDSIHSGFAEVFQLFKGIKGVAFHIFTVKEIVRNPIVCKIIHAYNGYTDTTELDKELKKDASKKKKEPMFLDD